MTTIINDTTYTINIDENRCDVLIPNGANELPTEVVLANLNIRTVFNEDNEIEKFVIETIHYQFDIAPNGKRINKNRKPTYLTSEVEAKAFELGMVGVILKKSIINGIFSSLNIAERVFDPETFELITDEN
jgi:hypothetical protein